MNRFTKAIVLGFSIFIISFAALGYVLHQTSPDAAYRSLVVFSEVLQRIQQDYVEDPDLPLVTSGALHGLLEVLDPRSSYMSPLEHAEYKKKLATLRRDVSVGVNLSKRFGYIAVVSVLPDTPAARGGIRSGDILESIAGFTTREMSIGQAELLLAGDAGSSVKLSVLRRGRAEPREVELQRALIRSPQLLTDRLNFDGHPADRATPPANQIAYIRVPVLDAGKAAALREKLITYDRQGIRRLALDLRDCGSGEVSEAVAAAQLFLEAGPIATLRGQTFPKQEFVADPSKVVWKHPVSVLISDGTSGAAEILAAAISGADAASRRGDLVGERTFGSASEQKLITLEDGAALVLTVANYYGPDGKSIPADGVSPTVPVADGDDVADFEDETQPPPTSADQVLKKAIEVLLAAPAARRAA